MGHSSSAWASIMADDDWQGDVSVFGFDVVGFTQQFDQARQVATKELTNRILQQAAREAGVVEQHSWWVDAGDGGYQLIRGDSRQALRILEKFVTLMDNENRFRAPHAQVHLRYALNYGPVHRSGAGAAQCLIGDAINDCARLLSGIAKGNIGQVVASASFKDQVLRFGRVHPGLFTRLPDVVDKHDKAHEVWNVCQQPGYGVPVSVRVSNSTTGGSTNNRSMSGSPSDRFRHTRSDDKFHSSAVNPPAARPAYCAALKVLEHDTSRFANENSESSDLVRDVDSPWCPRMVIIPAGRFLMGSSSREADRKL